MKNPSLLHHAKKEIKRDLRVWHLLVGVLLVGLASGYVVTHGKSRKLQMCHDQAQVRAKEKIVQELETGIGKQTVIGGDVSMYDQEYAYCLEQVGLQ